ncbi:hypothetical protein IC582_007367 [Cucumis melo]|uniref:Uncharacterized protein LOC103504031 n=1 Tax=Cucumis melo TaxID=3656 RepID=A0A1S3CT35_CUCME|nr:uncharacterized protein LOC103504031 [Cucumis melo]
MEFDLVNRPHQHPLFFNEDGRKINGEVAYCSRCRQPLRPPAFTCFNFDCNFHIHQSCLHLPPQIHSPFHPFHPLLLKTNNYFCTVCWQMPSGDVYRCRKCNFQIDIKCVLTDTKSSGLRRISGDQFRHFSHPHPLTLQLEENRKNNRVVCFVCDLLIKSTPSYFCSQCDTHFHQECAELPREFYDVRFHQHPLFLLPNLSFANFLCDSCNNNCRKFVYSCPHPRHCRFNLHVACLQSFNHEHNFTAFRNAMDSFDCRICGKKGNGFPWFCEICHVLAHRKCAKSPSTLRTVGHHLHDLTLTYFRENVRNQNRYCKICGEKLEMKFAGYGCYECNYFTHLDCAETQRFDLQSTPIVDSTMDHYSSNDEHDNEIQCSVHSHNLNLTMGIKRKGDRICDGCLKGLLSSSYGCQQCDFYVHKECAKLPKIKTHFLHQHLLTLISIPNFIFHCEACREYFHGFAYHCKICLSTFDIRCTSIKIPFKHPGHQHPLSLDRTNEEHNCEACGEGVKNRVSFRCVRCNFYLDAKCATLPLTVRYRFDAHPLNLTFVEEEESDEYYCDVCEEEREPWLWSYSCRICCFEAHLGCVLGEFPFVKSKIHEAHKHPLSMVMKGKEQKINCGSCNEWCGENLAFQCGTCKFNIHAIGRCYQQQLKQGKLAYTQRYFYSRGVELYEQPTTYSPIREGSRLHGGKGGNPWEEKVFSTIRAFIVYHQRCVHAIQIYYEKNGKAVWSAKHGGDGGTKYEVVFDYPHEYLVSIHGTYNNVMELEGVVIESLTLETNKRVYGPFGIEDGTKFSIPNKRVKIIGIHGKCSSYLDSIGLLTLSTRE